MLGNWQSKNQVPIKPPKVEVFISKRQQVIIMPPTTIKTKIFSILAIICACLLFFAGLNLPESYYAFLRIFVFGIAIVIMIKNFDKHWVHVLSFGLVAVIFNPFSPVFLYDKAIWILVDITTALLFLKDAYSLPQEVWEVELRKRKKRLFLRRLRRMDPRLRR